MFKYQYLNYLKSTTHFNKSYKGFTSSISTLKFTNSNFGWDSNLLRSQSPNQNIEDIYFKNKEQVKEKIAAIKKDGTDSLAIVSGKKIHNFVKQKYYKISIKL